MSLTGVFVAETVLLASDDLIIGQILRQISRAVVDWSVVGRRLYVGALVVPVTAVPLLGVDHWVDQGPTVERDGDGVVSQVIVRAANGVRATWPIAPAPGFAGLRDRVVSEPGITDPELALARAQTLFERWSTSSFSVVTGQSSLGPQAPVTVHDLVPGRVVNVAIPDSCLGSVVTPLRVTKTTVRIEDGHEVAVLVDLQPLGTSVVSR